MPFRFGPGLFHASADDGGVGIEEGAADILGEGEVGLDVPGVVMVEEDPSGAARLVAMRQEEVAVAPSLEARVEAGVVPVAGRLEPGVEAGPVLGGLVAAQPAASA
jgi:hypothetical protein